MGDLRHERYHDAAPTTINYQFNTSMLLKTSILLWVFRIIGLV